MMIVRKFITALIMFILNFQFVFAGVATGYSFKTTGTPNIELRRIDSYLQDLVKFKRELRGATDCPEAVTEILKSNSSNNEKMSKETKKSKLSEYQALVRSIQTNACRAKTTVRINKEEVESNELPNGCKKTDGFLKDISYELSLLEADEDISNFNFKVLKPRISKFIRRGLGLKIGLKQLLRYKLTDEIKKTIIIEYNQNVALSLRDMYFLLGAVTDKYKKEINELLPVIPSDLFEADTTEFSRLLVGTNPTLDPMLLDLVEVDNGIQLLFDDHGMVGRDIKTIMEHPAAKNYLYALRVMSVQMMANQIKNYNVLIGDNDEPINMPRSCVENNENGIWPNEFKITLNDDIANNLRSNLLRNHGLLYDEYDLLSYNYSIGNSEIDLVSHADSSVGTVEFDRYRSARAAVEQGYMDKAKVLRPVHDDFDTYSLYMEMKRGQAQAGYYKESDGGRNNPGKQVYMYKDISLLNNILTPAQNGSVETIKKDGYDYDVNFSQLNASEFLKNKMIAEKIVHPEDLITEPISRILKKNNIRIALPSLYAPAGYRNWGLRTLTEAVRKMIGKKDKVFYGLCRAYGNYFCEGTKDRYLKVYSYLKTLNLKGKYLPLDQLKDKDLEKHYVFLGVLWNRIRDVHNKLPEAIVNEEEFLVSQMSFGSPLARIRLGYVIAKFDLQNLISGKTKTYKQTRRGKRVSNAYKCENNNFSGLLTRLNKAAVILGIDKPLRPSYISSILSKNENLELFKKVLTKVNTKSTHTFSAKIDGNKTAYDIISKISSRTLSTVDSVNYVVNNYLNSGIDKKLYNQIDEIFYSTPARRINFFHEMAKEKNHEKRQDMFEERAEEFGIDDDLTLKTDVLNLDSDLKKPLYEEVVIRAAKIQKTKTYKKLKNLCQTDFNDHEKVKEYYFSTLKVQNKMNEALGIAKMPEELMDRVHALTFEEKMNMVKGISGFVLGAGALVLMASCPFTLGAGCAAAGALGVTAGFGLGASVLTSEIEMKHRADIYESHVNEMEEIGMTDVGASYNVSRSWAWAIISSLDVIPLLGIVSRGLSIGAKTGREAITSIYHNASKLGGKRAALRESTKSTNIINQEAEVNLAKLVLGYTTYTNKFTRLIKGKNLDDAAESLDAMNFKTTVNNRITSKINRTRRLFDEGKISKQVLKRRTRGILREIQSEAMKTNGGLYKYISDVSVNFSKADIDKRTAKMLSSYFNGNPKELASFMSSYAKRFKGNKVGKGSKVAKAKFKFLKAKRGGYEKGTNWIRTMWNENTYNMAKNHLKYQKLQKAIKGAKDAKQLEAALYKNMDDFVDIFTKAPLRLVDLPYIVIQGGWHIAHTGLGSMKGLKSMGMAVIIRKIANSRSLLVGESVKNEARAALGLKKVVAAESIAQIMKGLQVMSVKMARESIPGETQQILKELNKIRMTIIMEISNGLVKHPEIVELFARRGIQLLDSDEIPNVAVLKKLLFKNHDTETEALTNMLWGTVDMEKLLTKKAAKRNTPGVWQMFSTTDEKLLRDEFQFIVSRGMSELVDDTSVQGIQQYVLFSKLLMIKNKMGKVELF
jgi:hypothetical protein